MIRDRAAGSRRHPLVPNPDPSEALGRADVLCFDKTGTMAEGRIGLDRVHVAGASQPLDALDEDGRQALGEQADRLARRGYGALTVAERAASGRRELHDDRIARLNFTGLLALTDPVRGSAARAVHHSHAAREPRSLASSHAQQAPER